ncbi:uncharacterized protein HaLaN_20917 [Haematococcus lacustris]|uniref:Uncharacterized protein n=1 Tax=Haematococcus lacustris TaxID=44745 RepID=A0A699ZQ78_HAELA|nr:uncharacterized protein HaLaN_20917 [Haematococcus lacustris]
MLLELLGAGPMLRLLLPKGTSLDVLWYGLYFGVLGRDCAEVASDRMACALGTQGRRLLNTANSCGICGNELQDFSHLGEDTVQPLPREASGRKVVKTGQPVPSSHCCVCGVLAHRLGCLCKQKGPSACPLTASSLPSQYDSNAGLSALSGGVEPAHPGGAVGPVSLHCTAPSPPPHPPPRSTIFGARQHHHPSFGCRQHDAHSPSFAAGLDK